MRRSQIISRRDTLSGLGALALAGPASAREVAAILERMSPTSATEREAIVAAIAALDTEGLRPSDYGIDVLRAGGGDARAAWLAAGSHMLRGKTDAVKIEPDWTAPRRADDLVAAFDRARATGTLDTSLASLAPKQPTYAALKAELARLRAASAGMFTRVPAGPALKLGQMGERVELLQTRLAELGYAPASPLGVFDTATADALEAFQLEAGLEADGVAGPATLGALNRDLTNRIDAVRANMERWRWLPDDLGPRHVRVNIAGFSVEAWEGGAVARTHGAIVGKPFRATPVFSDAFRYLVFNPWWEVPPSLARVDKLPLFKRDPGAVSRLGYQVLDGAGNRVSGVDWNAVPAGRMPYRLRQAPGPLNALGQVKMMFPNRHNVYLHDTPDRGLFARRARAFSSGCVRTQDPIDLSEWLLRDTPGWDRARIDAALASGKETRADLSSRIPVHILYFTVVADASGGVRYLDDIYNRDPRLLAALGG